jgi:hypothetical protein
MTTGTKKAAENDLWHALEERRDCWRDAHVWSGRTEQQHQKLYAAHASGRLIDDLVEVYERRGTQKGGNTVQLAAMAKAIKAGCPLLEHVLIQSGERWTRYITPRARAGAAAAIEAAEEWAKWN